MAKASKGDAAGALWQRAAGFAARAHQGQVRGDGVTPYFAHPARVAMTVRDVFGCDDQEALAAALLHDVIEDTTTDYDDLAEAFGESVAGIVAALTKNSALPAAEREDEYDARLSRADWRARLIKLADVYDNFCDQGTLAAAKRKKIAGKLRRAVELAEADVERSEVMKRAVKVVKRLGGK